MDLNNLYSFAFFSIICVNILSSQTQELSGRISADGNLEGIHIINKSSYKYATTNSYGEFLINAKATDTLYFSSIQHNRKIVVITSEIVKRGTIDVKLENYITQLDEITIGKILSGDLGWDINGSENKSSINFYDLGIPGFIGQRKTQIQYRYIEASEGRYISWGIPPKPNLWKILNKITGRTNELKGHVEIEREKNTIKHIKDIVGPKFFKNYNLDDHLKSEFYHFCSDDADFQSRCHEKSDIEIAEFLEEKLTEFKLNISSRN